MNVELVDYLNIEEHESALLLFHTQPMNWAVHLQSPSTQKTQQGTERVLCLGRRHVIVSRVLSVFAVSSREVIKFFKLLSIQERKRMWELPSLPCNSQLGPGRSQEPGNPSRFPMWVAVTADLSYHHRFLAGVWSGTGPEARVWSAHKCSEWDVGEPTLISTGRSNTCTIMKFLREEKAQYAFAWASQQDKKMLVPIAVKKSMGIDALTFYNRWLPGRLELSFKYKTEFSLPISYREVFLWIIGYSIITEFIVLDKSLTMPHKMDLSSLF